MDELVTQINHILGNCPLDSHRCVYHTLPGDRDSVERDDAQAAHLVDLFTKREKALLEGLNADIHARASQIANDPTTEIQRLRSQHRDGQMTINGLAWAHSQIQFAINDLEKGGTK